MLMFRLSDQTGRSVIVKKNSLGWFVPRMDSFYCFIQIDTAHWWYTSLTTQETVFLKLSVRKTEYHYSKNILLTAKIYVFDRSKKHLN